MVEEKEGKWVEEQEKEGKRVQPAGVEEKEENISGCGLPVKKKVAGNSSWLLENGSPETEVGSRAGN